MASFSERIDQLSNELSRPTPSSVIHLQTLRMAIGYIAVLLPLTLVVGENLRDVLLPVSTFVDGAPIEASISAYFHTGMREVFVGSLCAIAVFLICYKGYERWDNLAANVAGISVLFVALCPTPEPPREASESGTAVSSVTLFSSASAPDPAIIGYLHFALATVFFVTLAIMALFLFTKTDQPVPTPEKLRRNRVYRTCGTIILLSIVAIATANVFVSEAWIGRTSTVFWLEAVATVAFGVSWLTKADVLLEDADRTVGADDR